MNMGQVENLKQTRVLHTCMPVPVTGKKAASEGEISFMIVLVFNISSYCFCKGTSLYNTDSAVIAVVDHF